MNVKGSHSFTSIAKPYDTIRNIATKIVQQDYIDEEAQMKVEESKEGSKVFDTLNPKANTIGRECDGGIKVIP